MKIYNDLCIADNVEKALMNGDLIGDGDQWFSGKGKEKY